VQRDWGIVGCAYMAREYCKVLMSKGITPSVYSRELASPNVAAFQAAFPRIKVQHFSEISSSVGHWLVCTSIESHEEVCSMLGGRIYCEKPFSHVSAYDAGQDISILMNRRYYYWVEFIKDILDKGKIGKIIACVPEKSIDALITQSIHVIDLLWYLAGPFRPATKAGNTLPTYVLSTNKDIPLVINMNYGAHENFSLRFYGEDGTVYEAKPLEAFSIAEGMEVREPDDAIPFRTYKPVSRRLEYTSTNHKPGLSELVDDLIRNSTTRLPALLEHREVHAWMERNMS
jgi:predicted dehydrogenase